jgi:hypothetical protein
MHDELRKMVDEFSAHLSELDLDARQKQRAAAQLNLLKTELSDDPDLAVICQAIRSLRNITEGAIGSLLATAATNSGVWQWIMRMFAGS